MCSSICPLFSVCQSVLPLSVHLSVTLSPKPLGGIQPNFLHHFPSQLECARATLFFHVLIHLSIHPSVRLSSIYLSVMLSPLNSTKLATSLPLMVRVCKSNIFFCAFVVRSSRYLLLNHWAEFSQTCYITFPHGKGVQEQHYFSVHLLSVHLSIMLSPPKPQGRIQPTCYITSPHSKGVKEQHYFLVCPSVVCPSGICPSSNLLLNPWGEFNQTCYMTSLHGKGVIEQVHSSIMLLATSATSVEQPAWGFAMAIFLPSTAHSS